MNKNYTFAPTNKNSEFIIGEEVFFCVPLNLPTQFQGYGIVEGIRHMPNYRDGCHPKQILIRLAPHCPAPTWIGSGWCWQSHTEFDDTYPMNII